MIAAVANNRVIGCKNSMPWHVPADLKWFKKITMGKSIVMGRKTWDSIGRALPGRQNIVLSRNALPLGASCDVLTSIEQVLMLSTSENEIMIIGGGDIYSLFLPYASRLYLTQINVSPEGDTWFPLFEEKKWLTSFEEMHQADERNLADYTFKIFDLK